MRFIPTTQAKVDTLKKQAKRLHRVGRGKHTELLDRVARGAGYEHWHHVMLCLRETEGVQKQRGLLTEIEAACQAALTHKAALIVTGPEAGPQPFVLMTTDDGDAWLLDPEHDHALCLVWHGVRQSVAVRDLPTRLEIEWDGSFELAGPFFSVKTSHAEIGERYIAGYQIDRLRELLESHRSADKRADAIFARADAVPLSSEIIQRLVGSGWDQERLLLAARQGAQYSPSRDSLLFPPVIGS